MRVFSMARLLRCHESRVTITTAFSVYVPRFMLMIFRAALFALSRQNAHQIFATDSARSAAHTPVSAHRPMMLFLADDAACYFMSAHDAMLPAFFFCVARLRVMRASGAAAPFLPSLANQSASDVRAQKMLRRADIA